MQTQTRDYRKVAEAALDRDWGMPIDGIIVLALDGATHTDTAPSDGRFLAEQTPLAPLQMAELLKDLFPPGVLGVIPGDGAVVGDALVRHSDIKRISLIGGTATGQLIQRSAAESVELVDNIGDPLDPTTEMGSLVSRREQERIQSMIETGVREGAVLRCGGRPPPGLTDGAYLAPTVLDDVTMEMKIGREEVFGPVLSVLSWEDLELLLDQVSAVPLGLIASILTKNIDHALSLADRIDCGYVWINDCAKHDLGAPFSGHRNSGTDSEEGIAEPYSFTQVKTVGVALGSSPFEVSHGGESELRIVSVA